MLQKLREANLIKIVGRAEEIGRPLLYGTTKRFLEVFGLASLDELPKVEALASGADAQPPQTRAVTEDSTSPLPEAET
jgi:segregation and condensation protein B